MRQPCRSLPLQRQTWPTVYATARVKDGAKTLCHFLIVVIDESTLAHIYPCVTSAEPLDSTGFSFYRID